MTRHSVTRHSVSAGGCDNSRHSVSEGVVTRHSVLEGAVTRHSVSEGAVTRHSVSEGAVTRHSVSVAAVTTRHSVSERGCDNKAFCVRGGL